VLIASGCLSEREKGQLLAEVDGLDAALGTRRWAEIARVVKKAREKPTNPYLYFPETERIIGDEHGIPRAAVQGASAYLKIADGCDRMCAFCAIPAIKGPMVSRTIDQVIKDAIFLQGLGVKEIILIAQDSTAYGRDLGLRDGLPALLKELVRTVPDVPWLRIMYTFPGSISDDLIEVMAENPQILPYLDLPLQHAHPEMLKRMKRPADLDWIRQTIARMRISIPSIALRTTFIVGYPGETEEEFNFLLEFLQEMRFDHVGIFPYYHEEGTSAYQTVETVPDDVKQERIQQLAAAQEQISLEINQGFIGKQLDVIIEGNGDGISAGRSYRDAPEIDGLILLKEIIEPGKMIDAQIIGALVHDLIAKQSFS
jgi:ribosomal protein S12 methylthiotransferase